MLTSRKDVTGWYDIGIFSTLCRALLSSDMTQDDIVRSDIVREFIVAFEKYFSQLEVAEQFYSRFETQKPA